ncbi:MAG TPA: hypothetical protein VEX62_07765 [Candidatus Limnocylindrales bacterium]|nr:hypothetical protein [Candidatus Limnocylindrales bacterium]
MRAAGLVLIGCLFLGGCLSIDIGEASDAPAAGSLPTSQVTPDKPSPAPATASPSPAPSVAPSSTPVPPPATDRPTDAPSAQPTDTPAPSTPRPAPSGDLPAACFDDEFSTSGYRWRTPLDWAYLASSTPDDLESDAVVDALERSFANITEAHNDCGRDDAVSAEATYAGTTELSPCVDDFADGTSVIGFGTLPRRARGNTLAIACPYLLGGSIVVEADILINEDIPWALELDDCVGFREMLESTVTHEIGHAFGLGHVSERRHGDLTMSTRSNGSCNLDEASLGLGDLLALEELYPIGE